MRISLNWLKDFIDISKRPDVIGRSLTNVGLAVDGMETTADDAIFELDITTNRPDCLNHFGVARELSVVFETALRRPQFKLVEASKQTSDLFTVSISDPELC